jgi:hypothetical protein
MDMQPEYDFSKGERGKFYHPDATLKIPVYLDSDVEEFIREIAERTGQDIDQLVNEWLRSNIHLIQSIQSVAS